MSNTNSKQVLLKSTFWYVFAGFVSKGLVFLIMPFYLRVLTKSEYGDYSNLLSWIAIVSNVLQMNLGIFVIQKQHDYKSNPYKLITNTFFALFLVSITAFLPVGLFNNFFATLLKIRKGELVLLIVYCFIVPCFYIFASYFRSIYKVKEYVLSNFGVALLAGIFSIISLTFFEQNKLEMFILSQTFPYILFGLISFFYSIIKSKSYSREIVLGALNHGIPSIPHLLSVTLITQLDRIMIYQIMGSETTAIFSLGANITLILITLSTSFNNAYVPWFIEQLKLDNEKGLRKISSIQLLVFTFIVFILLLLGPEIVFILGGSKYAETVYILPPLLIGVLFTHQYHLYLNIEYYLEKRKVIAFGTTIAAVFKMITNYIFIGLVGYKSTAYTTAFANLILLIIHIVAVKKYGKLDLVDQKVQWIAIIVLVALSPMLLLLYSHTFIRYALIVLCLSAMMIVFMKNRKQIYYLIKNVKK